MLSYDLQKGVVLNCQMFHFSQNIATVVNKSNSNRICIAIFFIFNSTQKAFGMSEEWCIEQLAKLQIKERRLDTLNEIRTALGSVGANEVNVSAKFLALLDSIDDYRDR